MIRKILNFLFYSQFQPYRSELKAPETFYLDYIFHSDNSFPLQSERNAMSHSFPEHILFYFLGGFTEMMALTTTPANTLINGGNQLVLIHEK